MATYNNDNYECLITHNLEHGDVIIMQLKDGMIGRGTVCYANRTALSIDGNMRSAFLSLDLIGEAKDRWFTDFVGYVSPSIIRFPSVNEGDYGNLTRIVLYLFNRHHIETPVEKRTAQFKNREFVLTNCNPAITDFLLDYARSKGLQIAPAMEEGPWASIMPNFDEPNIRIQRISAILVPTVRWLELTVQGFMKCCDNYAAAALSTAEAVAVEPTQGELLEEPLDEVSIEVKVAEGITALVQFAPNELILTEGNLALNNYLADYAASKGLVVRARQDVLKYQTIYVSLELGSEIQLGFVYDSLIPDANWPLLTVEQFIERCDNYAIAQAHSNPPTAEVAPNVRGNRPNHGPIRDPNRIELNDGGYATMDARRDRVAFIRDNVGIDISADEIMAVSLMITEVRLRQGRIDAIRAR